MTPILKRISKTISKFSILDWLVFLVSLCIIVFLVSTSIKKEKWITIEFKMTLTPASFPYSGETPPYWITNKIRQGDVQLDNFGKENLRIVSIKSWGYQSNETWVTASVKAKYKPKEKTYTFLYQPLEVGKAIDVTINGTNIHGLVTYIEDFVDSRTLYDITVKARLVDQYSPYSAATRGIDPWIAEAIQKGQQMKDLSGKAIAEILEADVLPAERIVSTSDGRVVVTQDPFKKDVFLTLRLKATKQNSTFFFLEDKAIIIGYSIPIYLDNVLLMPVITDIL